MQKAVVRGEDGERVPRLAASLKLAEDRVHHVVDGDERSKLLPAHGGTLGEGNVAGPNIRRFVAAIRLEDRRIPVPGSDVRVRVFGLGGEVPMRGVRGHVQKPGLRVVSLEDIDVLERLLRQVGRRVGRRVCVAPVVRAEVGAVVAARRDREAVEVGRVRRVRPSGEELAVERGRVAGVLEILLERRRLVEVEWMVVLGVSVIVDVPATEDRRARRAAKRGRDEAPVEERAAFSEPGRGLRHG